MLRKPDNPAVESDERFRALIEAASNGLLTADAEALLQSEARFRGAFQSAVIGKALVAIDGSLGLVNAALCEMLGYSAEELGSFSLSQITHPDDVELDRDELRRLLDGEITSYVVEKRFVHRSGHLVSGQMSVSLVRASDGTPVNFVAQIQNVTERKAAEEALAQSEQRFRGAFDAAPVGMALTDGAGRFLSVNDALCAINGYSAEELLQLRWQEVTHPDDLGQDESAMQELIDGTVDSIQLEKRYLHREGDTVWCHLSVSAVRDADGVPLHFVAQILDITERKQAEEALRQSEARLLEAQQLAQLGSFALDFETGVLQWTDEIYRIFGLERDVFEPTFEAFLERVHPDDRESVEQNVAESLANGRAEQHEYRIVRPDGSIRWLSGRRDSTLDEQGRPLRMKGTALDVTHRKEAEQQLAEVERRYRTLVEQLPLAMYIRPIDTTNPNVYASPQIERLLGYSQEEWLTDAGLLARIVHPDDRDFVVKESEILRETGKPFRGEYRYIHRDGHEVWVQDETYLVVDDEGEQKYVQGYLLDITERKRAEQERDRLRDELHHAQKLEAIGQLAGAIAHDFNNTLTAIRGYGELLEAGLPADGPFRRYAEEIRKTAEAGAALPRQLLAFARKQPLQTATLALNDVVADSCRLLGPLLGDRISLSWEPGPPLHVVGDGAELTQALLNLALNARDAMPAGGELEVSTRHERVGRELAERHQATPGDFAVLTVRDTGTGMDAATLARVFEPFFTTKEDGTGLGLATLYGMTRQSGGFVTVESERDRGTIFELYLPRGQAAARAQPEPVTEPQAGIGTVLLAEDEDSVRGLVREVLELAGYDVVDAANGADALAALERQPGRIDVLVTDLKMPGMDGHELTRRARENDPALPTIAISAYSDSQPEDESVNLLAKPFSSAQLLGAVDAAIGDRQGSGRKPRKEEISLVIADDHPPVLDSVSNVLATKGFRVVGTASDGDTALRRIVDRRPQVALVDIRMAGLSGVEVARRAAVLAPGTAVVLYTGQGDGDLVRNAMNAGAKGFLLKGASLNDIARVLHRVAKGAVHVDPEVADALADPDVVDELPALTDRERQILKLLAEGKTNEGAASHLSISPETVQTHVRKAMSKLQADTRTAAVATALRLALIR